MPEHFLITILTVLPARMSAFRNYLQPPDLGLLAGRRKARTRPKPRICTVTLAPQVAPESPERHRLSSGTELSVRFRYRTVLG